MRFNLFYCVLIISTINFSIGCECGIEGSISRIYRGQKTRPHKYPWLAQILLYSDLINHYYAYCGGSLIDDQHVITAAHCVTIYQKETLNNPNNIHVYLGLYTLSSQTNQTNRPEIVSSIWIHPKYNEFTNSHDIAILTLSKPVKFTQKILPICLPNTEIDLDHLVTAGWGRTLPNGTASEFPQEVDVSYLTTKECQRRQSIFFMNEFNLDPIVREIINFSATGETHICAVNLKTQGSVCPGDSGGPLMYKNKGIYYLVGIACAVWEPCGPSISSTGVYTRIDLYQDFIKSIASNSCWKD